MLDFIKRVAADRIGGDRPGAPRALGAAALVGTAGAVITYKLLRK
ncbi:MAG TPA: hypothetical protein VLB79_11235 [Solirubrobacterales bacterium]|nr:hypothetical protein [Solirubrobacterales bacterium]